MGVWRPLNPDRQDAPDHGGETRELGMESARRSSSLPSGVFRARSPEVEQALAGGVAGVFLEHMTRLEGPVDVAHDRPPGTERRSPDDAIDQDAIEALLAGLHAHGDEPAPRLDHALASERTFVLIDLSVHGDQKARIAATAELAQLAAGGSPGVDGSGADEAGFDRPGLEGHGADSLRQLCAELDHLAAAGMQTLPLLHLRRAAGVRLSQLGSGL